MVEIEVIVTQEMLENDATITERGLTVGDKFTREETAEEVAAREAAVAPAPKAGDTCVDAEGKAGHLQADAGGHLVCVLDVDGVAAPVAAVNEDESAGGEVTGSEVNGVRHPLA